jgi:hypothetical protein
MGRPGLTETGRSMPLTNAGEPGHPRQESEVRHSGICGLLLLLAVAACGGDAAAPVDTTPGSYALVSINAAPLPAIVYDGDDGQVEVTAGMMVLGTHGSYTESLNVRLLYADGRVEAFSTSETGVYVRDGTALRFTIPANESYDALTYHGTLVGGTLTYTFDGVVFVFEKR